MNTELMEALNILEKEKSISKDVLLEAIEQSLIQACKNHFGKADNVKVTIDRETGDFSAPVFATFINIGLLNITVLLSASYKPKNEPSRTAPLLKTAAPIISKSELIINAIVN